MTATSLTPLSATATFGTATSAASTSSSTSSTTTLVTSPSGTTPLGTSTSGSSTSGTVSPLDTPPAEFAEQPFYAETVELLRCVRDHDFAALSTICDDDFGIVDVDPAGLARVIRDREGWEGWFHELFATLDALSASTDSEVLDYRAIAHDTMGFSVLEFRQYLMIGEHTATFDCVTTIVWKHTPDGWREARWHGSVVSSVIPDGMQA